MGILDEIEVHATQTARLQARAGNAEREALLYEAFAKKRARKIFVVSFVSAFIPFVGWAITMFCWLFSANYLHSLNAKKSGSDAAIVGMAWGFLTAGIPWATYAIGFHGASNVEMLIFYILAAAMVYGTFDAKQSAFKAARIAREVVDHIASQG
jgi:apolipoprotein N-acyltransferase